MIDIIYEDNHIIVVSKPCGMLVQGDATGDKTLADSIKNYIKIKYQKPGNVYLGIIHRLDRPTSGVVIFARTSKALTRLNSQFSERKIEKKYWAIVSHKPPKNQDSLTHYLLRNTKQNKSYAYDKIMADSKMAILHYKILHKLKHYYLLEIDLETGRHHQIRAQLSKIGCIIKGDLKYGAKRSNKNGGIDLHARSLIIFHPTLKKYMTFEAKPPKDKIWGSINNIYNQHTKKK